MSDQQASGPPPGAQKRDPGSYVTDDKNAAVPVQSADARVEDPIDPSEADTVEQLQKDDTEAIDKSNIVKGRTRGA